MIIARTLGFTSGAKLPPILASLAGSGSPVAPTVTTVTTASPTHVTFVPELQQLTLVGSFSGTTSRRFEYGPTSASVTASVGSITNSQTSFAVTSLADSTTRHYRAVGINNSYTQTISGTINPNFFATTVTLVRSLNSDMSDPIDTTNLGTFTGSTPVNYSHSFPSQSAGTEASPTTYHFRVTATNIGGTVTETSSYTVGPAVTNGSIISATTARAIPTPALKIDSDLGAGGWNAATAQRTMYRVYAATANEPDGSSVSTTYRYEKLVGASWVNQGTMSASGSNHVSAFFWADSAAGATTTSSYRIIATDRYGRTATSSTGTITPLRENWGFNNVEGAQSSLLSSFEVETRMNVPGESNTNMVSLVGSSTSRYQVHSYRVTGAAVFSGTAFSAFTTNRRIRFWTLNAWTGRQTSMENGNSTADSGWISYVTGWLTDQYYFGVGDMPVWSCTTIKRYSSDCTAPQSEWGVTVSGQNRVSDVTMQVRYYQQAFARTSANASATTSPALEDIA